MNNILICEPSPEGIFSAVYDTYERKLNPNITKIVLGELDNYELFAEYISVETDFEKAEKVWLNSISGIFAGIFLTFSGLGVSLNPLASFKEGALMLSIILVYAVLGLLCGFFTLLLTKTKKQENPVDKMMDKTNEK